MVRDSEFIRNKMSPEDQEDEIVKEDQIVKLIGPIGKFQATLMIPVFFIVVVVSWEVLIVSFLAQPMDYWCVDGMPENISDVVMWENTSSPRLQNGFPDKCNVFIDPIFWKENGLYVIENKNQTRPCTIWKYDESDQTESLVNDFDLVCGRDWLITVAQSVYMSGTFIGFVAGGYLSDKYGRQPVIFYGTIVLICSGLFCGFSIDIYMFIFMRMGVAAANSSMFLVCYIYCMEMVSGKWQSYIGVCFELPWALGYTVLPGLAYCIRRWWALKLLVSTPLMFVCASFYFFPESPRWLLATNNLVEAKKVLLKAITYNGSVWPESFQLSALIRSVPEDLEDNNRVKTFIQFYLWFAASFVYYGLALNTDVLMPGDLYVNFTVSGLMEFPTYLLTAFTIRMIGRRIPLAMTYFISGLFLLLTLVCNNESERALLSMVGKFGITSAYAIIFVYATELFPTVVRGTAIGLASLIGRFGTTMAPIVGKLMTDENESIIIGILGGTSLVASILTLWLPETLGKKMPDTLEEGQAFGKDESFFAEFKKWLRNTKEDSPD